MAIFARISRRFGACLLIASIAFVGIARAQPAQSSRTADADLFHKVWTSVARHNYDVSEGSRWAHLEHLYDAAFAKPGMNEAYAYLLMPMLRSPYAKLLDADDMKVLNQQFTAQKASVNIAFAPDTGADHLFSDTGHPSSMPFIMVGRESTAEAAGLTVHDALTAVDGVSVSKLGTDKVADALAGEVGSNVVLTVIRVDRFNESPRDVTIKRELVIDHGATFERTSADMETIQLLSFVPDTTLADVRKAFDQGEGAKVFKVNLRNDQGGQFENAIGVASMFVEKGLLVRVRRRIDSDLKHPKFVIESYEVTKTELLRKIFDETTKKTEIAARSPREPYRLNHRAVVIAVNGKTASASEVVIGAIKDHANTIYGARSLKLVGVRTFGKGIGQSIFEGLPGGYALILTTLRYLSPNGHWVGDGDSHRIGFEPDVKATDEATQDRLFEKAAENSLRRHG